MDNKRIVAVATALRSERGLVEPIITRLRKRSDVASVIVFDVEPGEQTIHTTAKIRERLKAYSPDVLLVPCDRVEMTAVAMVAYYMKIPVFHLFAGIGYTGTYDDMNRRVISSYSYMMFCEDDAARQRLIKSGEEPWRCVITGPTHLDDVKLDTSIIPNQPFDVVLINPNPADPDDTEATLKRTVELINYTKLTFWIEPNEDYPDYPNSLFKPQQLTMLSRTRIVYMNTVPRPQFLALLKYCERFISNSSAATYEAPYLSRDIINPGLRNAGRPKPQRTERTAKLTPSDKIVTILATYPINKLQMLKRYD